MTDLDNLLIRMLEVMNGLQHLQTEDRQRLTALLSAYIETLSQNVEDALQAT